METQTLQMFDQKTLSDIVRLWGFNLKHIRSEIPIFGSPERSEFRTVIESEHGNLFLLEQIFPSTLKRKEYIAQSLDALKRAGMETVIPYCKDRNGRQILTHDNHYWQIQRFFSGVGLDRPDYAFEKWRGGVLADFLLDLNKCAHVIDEVGSAQFSLKNYICRFMVDIKQCDPQYLTRIQPVFDFLRKNFFPFYNDLSVGFCHGDFHPINVIWSPSGIGAVIDWEFCGQKPEMYDAANMIGCLGIEHPSSLTADCVRTFIQQLQEGGIYAKESWKYLVELILANRFGWMSEWLRKKDLEMVEMECDYWDILMNNRKALKEIWKI